MIYNILYCLVSLIFILNEYYFILNKERLLNLSIIKDLVSLTKLDVIYYFLRFLFWIWLIIGLFCGNYLLWILLLVGLIKVPIYHLNKKIYAVYNNLTPIISIIILLIIALSVL
jgi:hypothetical protein